MSGKRSKKESCNENWKLAIAAYDEECQCHDKEFYRKHIIIGDSCNEELTEEENEVLNFYLNGFSLEEIAKQNNVELELITSLMDIIKAKLSI